MNRSEKQMKTGLFLSIEDEEPDLIFCFALEDPELPVRSLILMRTPVFENLLPPEERGVSVTMGGHRERRT
jgi:hypothetical protein